MQCWEKATNYFSIEERFVHLTEDTFVATPQGVKDLIDENTIGDNLASLLSLSNSCNWPQGLVLE